jgi:hypothetical protein
MAQLVQCPDASTQTCWYPIRMLLHPDVTLAGRQADSPGGPDVTLAGHQADGNIFSRHPPEVPI